MAVYDAAFYAAQRDGSSRSARVIAPLLLDAVRPRSVVDVGCGIGTWLAAFKDCGVTDVVGIDGSYVRPESLLIAPEDFVAADLQHALTIDRRFDLATSFEVAEHLPQSAAAAFVRTLTALAPVVTFSAAIPYQGGTGHVNEQWPSYWAALFLERGYRVLDIVRPAVWTDPNVEFWYVQNTLLFVDEAHLANDARLRAIAGDPPRMPLDVVHPTMYAMRERSAGARLGRRVRGLRGSVLRLAGRGTA